MPKKRVGELLTKFHHMGVLVKNLDEAVEYFQALGIGPFGPSNLVHTDRVVYGKSAPDVKNIVKATKIGPIGIELIQPVSGESPPKRILESRGEGIYHIAFVVDDIEEATSIMMEAGFKVIYSSKNEGGGGMAFFDTDRVGGIVIELEELPPHLADDPYWGIKSW
ncbi:MAG: VOC family protein [Dehalococcoidales bacterium]|jgi:methylmalonyl-CoA epimerase|nr:VOC family protein [Dehalococcoidales bacterium]